MKKEDRRNNGFSGFGGEEAEPSRNPLFYPLNPLNL
jgi:hypothetical protein